MASEHNENSNKETRAESSKRDHHLCFPEVNVRTLRNRCHREDDDQDSPHQENSCHVPSSLPSSSQCPETCNTRRISSSDADPSQSSAVTHQPGYLDASLEGEDHAGKINLVPRSNEAPVPSLQSSEKISDSEDDCTGYFDGSGSSRLARWISRECGEEDPLVSLCSFSGTMGFVHVSCLEPWLNEQNVDYSEICGQRFRMAAQPKGMHRFFPYVWQSEGRLRRAFLSDQFYLAMVALACLIMLVAALGVIKSEGVVWPIAILVFLSCAFLAYRLQCSFQRLHSLYNLFSKWHFGNPVRGFEVEPSVGEVSVGLTERIDARADVEPSTFGGRRRS